MNKFAKIAVTVLAFAGSIVCLGVATAPANVLGNGSGAGAGFAPAEQATGTSSPSHTVIDLEPLVIVGSSKVAHKVNQKPAKATIAKVAVNRLRVLEQGGRPGGEFVLSTE